MDKLHQVSPALAGRLSKTIGELDGIMRTQSMTYTFATIDSIRDPDRTERRHRELAERYEGLLAEVRRLDGFGEFMRLMRFADLEGIARDGLAVVVNLCEDRCDALVLTAAYGIRHVPLPDADFRQLECAQEELAFAAGSLEEEPTADTMRTMDSVLLKTLRLLWKTIAKPVIEELRALDPIAERLFWCMAGAADMPIHAAGAYEDGCLNLPDIVVSSYTPKLVALLRARKSAGAESARILAVAQSETAGFCDLPCAKTEIEVLQEHASLPVTALVDGAISSAAVLGDLRMHSWVHLCCHGTVDAQQPLLSTFHLGHVGHLNIETLMQAQLPQADFAYLSACHTAVGSVARNESMSLAAVLQVTGFRSIVATMYSIGDDDGPVVAREVYKYMFRDGAQAARSSDAAVGVHRAARALQRSGAQLFRWVSDPRCWVGK